MRAKSFIAAEWSLLFISVIESMFINPWMRDSRFCQGLVITKNLLPTNTPY